MPKSITAVDEYLNTLTVPEPGDPASALDLEAIAQRALNNDEHVRNRIAALESEKGQPGGLATLDADGKLVQPRRIVSVIGAFGVTADVQTTSAPGTYVLPDPQVELPAVGNRVVIFISIRLKGDTDAVRGAVVSPAYSTDGGVTWTELGGVPARRAAHTCANGCEHSIVTVNTLWLTKGVTYKFGIMLGANAGTVTAVSTHRNLVVMEVDL